MLGRSKRSQQNDADPAYYTRIYRQHMSHYSAEMQRFLSDHPVVVHVPSFSVARNSRRHAAGASGQTMDSGTGPRNEQLRRSPDEISRENLAVRA